MVNSIGLPLEVVLSDFKQRGLVPDWPDFIEESLKCGWNPRTLRSRIESSVGDVYGPKHRHEVMKRFDLYMKLRE